MRLLRTLLAATLLLQSFYSFSQPGIKFESGLSWVEIKEKARKENKYIFVDAYTTWCGPCKMMEQEIFPLPNVGEFHNNNFINVRAQLDTTAKDNDTVRKFYSDAHEIQTQYNVHAFPTFLYFNPQGELVHRTVGSSTDQRFLEGSSKALNPKTQYYPLKQQYFSGKRDTAFLRELLDMALSAYDKPFSDTLAIRYLSEQPLVFDEFNLFLLQDVTKKPTDKGFNIFLNDADKVDSVLGEGQSRAIVKRILTRELVIPTIYTGGKRTENVDWTKLEKKLSKEYPAFSRELVLSTQADHFIAFKKWKEFSTAVNEYVQLLGKKASPYELNNFAWTVFERCEDKDCLEAALKWSAASLDGKEKNNPMLIDTYANLLYKLGRKDEAIARQTEAVRLSGDRGEEVKTTLDKMKKGEKTW